MSIQLVVNGLLIVILIGYIAFRQLTWRAIDPARMWRMPAILALIGLVTISSTTKVHLLTPTDIAFILIDIVISFGIGALMGVIATIRPMSSSAIEAYRQQQLARDSGRSRNRRPIGVVTLETRTGWLGLGLWVVFVAVRIGIDTLAGYAGSAFVASTGMILIAVAANRAARIAVISYRASRVSAVVA